MSRIGKEPITVPAGVDVIMAIGYGLAARDPQKRRPLIEFSILVKVVALVFLVAYWLFVARNQVVLLSGLGDGAMAAAIAAAYMTWRRSDQPGE